MESVSYLVCSAHTTIMLFAILQLLVLFILTLWYFHWFSFYKYLKNVPGPVALPIFGNAFQIGFNTTEFLPSFMKLKTQYGGVIKLFFGKQPCLLITDYEATKYFLTSTKILKKTFSYKFLYNWLGNGLLTGHEKHAANRKIIAPAYHFKELENYVKIFDKISLRLIQELESELNENSFDVSKYIKLFSLDVITDASIGFCMNALEHKETEYQKAVNEMCRIILERTINPIEQISFTYFFTKNYRTEKKCLAVLNEFSLNVIRKRRQQLLDGGGDNKNCALLDILLQSGDNGEGLSDDEILAEVQTFIFAGHDTVSTALNFIVYRLSLHQDVQEKAFEEQRLIAANDKNLTTRHLNEMKYLDMVIKETMRLYPPVPFYGRELSENVEYPPCSITIPKGTAVVMFAYGIHRDERVFSNPEDFDPDRFLTENKYSFNYVPFSSGPRNCIGQKFAVLEMKTVLSKMLLNFKILPALPKFEPILAAETVLASKNGISIRLERRK